MSRRQISLEIPMTTFKTYGSAIESLIKHLHPLLTAQHDRDFSTTRYFVNRSLVSHRGFQDWAEKHGVQDMAGLLESLKSHVQASGTPSWRLSLRHLLEALPDEFNVRGVWTPEEVGTKRNLERMRGG